MESDFASSQYAAMAQESPMSWFFVRLMKDVLGENNCHREVCQSIAEIDASSEDEAAEVAKQWCCRTQNLNDWSMHADRINIRAADSPS